MYAFFKTIKRVSDAINQHKISSHTIHLLPGAMNCLTLVNLDLSATLAIKQPFGTVHSLGLLALSLSSAVSYTSI